MGYGVMRTAKPKLRGAGRAAYSMPWLLPVLYEISGSTFGTLVLRPEVPSDERDVDGVGIHPCR